MAEATKAPELVMGEENLISKITIRDIGCNPKKVAGLPEGERVLPLCRIYGKANAVKTQIDPKAPDTPFVYFVGTFEAINLDSGDVFRSGKLFLPKGLSELMEAQVKGALDVDKNSSITFGFEIQAVKAANPIGYSYQAAALRKPEAEDELAGIRKLIKALPSSKPKVLEGVHAGAAASQGNVRKSA